MWISQQKQKWIYTVQKFASYAHGSDGNIAISSVCPSVHPSVMLSTPKSLDVIQPNLVCELLT